MAVAINSRLPARRWREKSKRDASRSEIANLTRDGGGIKGGRGGIVQGRTRVGKERGVGKGARDGRGGEGVRLHTPPRGLPHSDSPIRMSK